MLSEVTLARPSTFSAAFCIMLCMQRERERDRNGLSAPLPHFSKQNCSILCIRNVYVVAQAALRDTFNCFENRIRSSSNI